MRSIFNKYTEVCLKNTIKRNSHLTEMYFFLLLLISFKHLLLTPIVNDPIKTVHIKVTNRTKEASL